MKDLALAAMHTAIEKTAENLGFGEVTVKEEAYNTYIAKNEAGESVLDFSIMYGKASSFFGLVEKGHSPEEDVYIVIGNNIFGETVHYDFQTV
jgi:hypothetical protein